jgi:hypothetical protein
MRKKTLKAKIRSRYSQVGKSDKAIDKTRKAKKVGWRKSKGGSTYFENRRNRSDKDRRKRL